jgi:hypothetical protein
MFCVVAFPAFAAGANKKAASPSEDRQATTSAPAPGLEMMDVTFTSTPSGANIYLETMAVGRTPVTLKLRAGEYRIAMELNGYERWSENITVQPTHANVVKAELRHKSQPPVEQRSLRTSQSGPVGIPGCQIDRPFVNQRPGRDYSKPSSRLIGRWASTDPLSAAIRCQYFGPIDPLTKTGVYIHYSLFNLEAMEKKAPLGSWPWERSERTYQVLREVPDGNEIELRVFFPNGKEETESHSIDCYGINDTKNLARLQLSGRPYELTDVSSYVDDRNLVCPEENERWMAEDLASKSAEGLARMAKALASGKDQQQPATSAMKNANPSVKDWAIVDVDSRVTERNSTWWRYAWKLTLRNDAREPHLFEGQIEFQDADGFIIDTSSARDMIVPANGEKVFTGSALITAPVADNVKRTNAKVAKVR